MAVIGLGYIGLPTAAVLATQGLKVVGCDINPAVVDAVNSGEVTSAEPDLQIAVAGAVSQGRLSAQVGIPHAEVYILALPTPLAERNNADLSHVHRALDEIAPLLSGGELIVLESTAPPGTTQGLADRLQALRPDLCGGTSRELHVDLAHCPERVLPGRIMVELVTNDRIVGGLTPAASERAGALYRTFCQGEIHLTDAATAEVVKLAENAFRDVNIAFANELAATCDDLGVGVWELISLANRHPRVNILAPGPGVGGHCIAVDPWFLISASPQHTPLMRTAREVNDTRPRAVVQQVLTHVGQRGAVRIAALGLAFKADVDDLRESPAVQIVRDLAGAMPDATIAAVEPHVEQLPHELAGLPNIGLAGLQEAVTDADLVILLVDHSEFRRADPATLGISATRLIDTRGVWSGSMHTTGTRP